MEILIKIIAIGSLNHSNLPLQFNLILICMFPKNNFIYNLFVHINFLLWKKRVEYIPSEKIDPYKVYQEGLDAFKQADFFTLKRFSEAELNFTVVEHAAKAAIARSTIPYMELIFITQI